MTFTIVRGSSLHRRLLGAALLVGGLAVVVAPHVLSEFRTFQLTMVLVWAVGALGTNLLVGYGGQISLAFNLFFAVGAYTTAILINRHDWPWLLTLPAGAAIAFAVGLALGRATGRLQGLYLAMSTLAVALIVPNLIKRFTDLTGGNAGQIVSTPKAPSWSGLFDDQWRYYIVVVVAAVMFLIARNLVGSGVGRGLLAIRDEETVAGALGVNTARTKAITVGVSAGYASVCGSLYVLVIGIIAPDSVTLFVSINLLVAVVVGGLGTIAGAIAGGIFLQFAPSVTSAIDLRLGGVFYGLLVIAFLMVAPKGVVGLLKQQASRVLRFVTPRATEAEQPEDEDSSTSEKVTK